MSEGLPEFLRCYTTESSLRCQVQTALLQAAVPFGQPGLLGRCFRQIGYLQALLISVLLYLLPGISNGSCKGRS